MERIVRIAESDYHAVTQWDDEGGKPVDIVYQLIPDLQREPNRKMVQNAVKDSQENPRRGSYEKEALLAVKR